MIASKYSWVGIFKRVYIHGLLYCSIRYSNRYNCKQDGLGTVLHESISSFVSSLWLHSLHRVI